MMLLLIAFFLYNSLLTVDSSILKINPLCSILFEYYIFGFNFGTKSFKYS